MKQRYLSPKQRSVREINLATVLRCLQEGPALSRAGLATLTNLNKTTISSLVETLLEQGLVHEIGLDISGGGRPGTLLELNPQAGHIIGLELGVGYISLSLTDFTGQTLWHKLQEINPSETQDFIIKQALNLVDEARLVFPPESARLLGLGVSIPGMVDIEQGEVIFSPNLQWRNVPLGKIFKDHTNLPTYIENDANAAALGEYFFGATRQVQNFIFLSIGVGLGGGLFLKGELYRGAWGIAGEIGHTYLVAESKRPCRCGRRGCWEVSSNQYALIERIQALLHAGRNSIISQDEVLTLTLIAQAARAGDAVALEALTDTGKAIGLGVANLINIFNPHKVVIGGGMGAVGDYLMPAIKHMTAKHVLRENQSRTEVILSTYGTSANVIGAVALVVNDILKHPNNINTILYA